MIEMLVDTRKTPLEDYTDGELIRWLCPLFYQKDDLIWYYIYERLEQIAERLIEEESDDEERNNND